MCVCIYIKRYLHLLLCTCSPLLLALFLFKSVHCCQSHVLFIFGHSDTGNTVHAHAQQESSHE